MKRADKRGFIGDVLTIIMTGFVVAVVVLICVLVLHTVRNAFEGDANIPNEGKAIIINGDDQYPGAMDFFLMTMLFGLPLVSACLAFFLDTSSIFLWIMLILTFIFVIIGAVFANLWNEIINATAFAGIASEIPMTAYVFANYALYALFTTVIIMGGMFWRIRSNS